MDINKNINETITRAEHFLRDLKRNFENDNDINHAVMNAIFAMEELGRLPLLSAKMYGNEISSWKEFKSENISEADKNHIEKLCNYLFLFNFIYPNYSEIFSEKKEIAKDEKQLMQLIKKESKEILIKMFNPQFRKNIIDQARLLHQRRMQGQYEDQGTNLKEEHIKQYLNQLEKHIKLTKQLGDLNNINPELFKNEFFNSIDKEKIKKEILKNKN
ncbi:MAG: hypothetical protein PHS81_03855 [Candidatus Nanoarchaeia archaeon]|nr:hypothetical protein [Candidatus Nanoarchaeia archaeon]